MMSDIILPVVPEGPWSCGFDFFGVHVPKELQRFYAGHTDWLVDVVPLIYAPHSSDLVVRSAYGFEGLSPSSVSPEVLLTSWSFDECRCGPSTLGEGFVGSLLGDPELLARLYAPEAQPWGDYDHAGCWMRGRSVSKESGDETESSGGPIARAPRWRKRGKLTRSLAVLGSELRRGWWRDLPESGSPAQDGMNFLVKFLAPGTKLGVVNQVCVVRDDVPERLPIVEVQFSSENGTRNLWVSPGLVASLFTVRCFRAVDEGLLASLRSRARLWARDQGMSDMDLAFILPGSVMLAALPQPDEVLAVGALRSSAAVWSSKVLRGLSNGVAASYAPNRSFMGTLRVLLGGGKDTINSPVCGRLNLSGA